MIHFKKTICLLVLASVLLLAVGCGKGETAGSANEPSQSQPTESGTEKETVDPPDVGPRLESIKHVGEVPDFLAGIVEDNFFCAATAYSDRVLKAETVSENKELHTAEFLITMTDIYGKKLAEHRVTASDACHIGRLVATEDGGFLFVLGFTDYYLYDEKRWAGDDGCASRVIKCAPDGSVSFDALFDSTEGSALEYCFEKDGRFYLFGSREDPETKESGVIKNTDCYSVILGNDGKIIKEFPFGGSDFDEIYKAVETDDGFTLFVRSQSTDGFFADSASGEFGFWWTVSFDGDLSVVRKEKVKYDNKYSYDPRVGIRDGKEIFGSDPLFDGFDAGTPTSFIDYGDFYLIVSENATGQYMRTPPYISSIWCYTETVYSGYGKDGALLFRTAVDSSPDFDAMAAEFSVD
ncbi:MAG: hypothetical protein IJS78_07190 [Clostridia bacterium]|nr:hypothetical protein [Clostridia bacterium]